MIPEVDLTVIRNYKLETRENKMRLFNFQVDVYLWFTA